MDFNFTDKAIFVSYKENKVYKIRSHQDYWDYYTGKRLLEYYGIKVNPVTVLEEKDGQYLTVEPKLTQVPWAVVYNYLLQNNHLEVFLKNNIGDIHEGNWGISEDGELRIFNFALRKTDVADEVKQLNAREHIITSNNQERNIAFQQCKKVTFKDDNLDKIDKQLKKINEYIKNFNNQFPSNNDNLFNLILKNKIVFIFDNYVIKLYPIKEGLLNYLIYFYLLQNNIDLLPSMKILKVYKELDIIMIQEDKMDSVLTNFSQNQFLQYCKEQQFSEELLSELGICLFEQNNSGLKGDKIYIFDFAVNCFATYDSDNCYLHNKNGEKILQINLQDLIV